ncbi:6cf46192-8b88-45a0-9851-93acb9407b0f [Thermothielavioides terrestris]|uniref:6cf46192-8b88-45a0-9851-93acb9407b0f n=1 Tax=Thermothielavioides terrestris TaxID=2587410 RepID=A0A3S4B1G4_9PEZI|nr:6cf46192-8b88-45a0-9851-93acb9407b0f [Thermothielavioides terrestris]
MSQYPHGYGYGQYRGQHAQQPFGYQTMPGYPAPGHNDLFAASTPQNHRELSQSAYNLNATHIPGLGIGGAAPAGTYNNFSSGIAAWGPPPGFSASASNLPPRPYGTTSSEPPAPQSRVVTSSSNTNAALANQPAPGPTRRSADVQIEAEEGELSEGQFEDLYEPRDEVPDASAQSVSKPQPAMDPSRPASVADTPDGGFYGTDEDDGAKDSRGKEDTSAQQSPKDLSSSFRSVQEAKKEAQKAILRLWPLGIKYQTYIDEGFDEDMIKGLFRDLHLDIPKNRADSPPARRADAQRQESTNSKSTVPSLATEAQSQQAASAPKDAAATSDQSGKGEERKDRIARLLAAKAAKAPASQKPPIPTTTEPKRTETKPQAQESVQKSPPGPTPASAPAPAPAPTPTPTPASASAPTPSTAPKSKVWGEKERLIQQKIAALQKSREAQAQKSATDTTDSVGSTLPKPTTAGASAAATPTGPQAAAPPVTAGGGPSNSSLSRLPIPGLSSSSHPHPNSSSQRKRPVAADFVDYSSGPAPLKRPFGQARKETSLIIDVSDESDDEEMEMDMDMESPVDESSSRRASSTPGPRGPAIRDFPPLTDTLPQRQFSSPAPSVTPPAGPVNNRKRETELDLKEKEIQEMRRRIALAEAKRKAKQALGGSETPKQTEDTAEPKENKTAPAPHLERADSMSSVDRLDASSPQLTPEPTSMKLAKPSDRAALDVRQRAERRGRIVSFEIPRVESTLKEKLDRLRKLQDEEARLKAEIDSNYAEKKRLADELQQLDATPVESPQLNGLESARDSATEGRGVRQVQPGNASVDIQTEQPSSSSPTSESSREPGEVSTDEAEASRRLSGEPSSSAADKDTGAPTADAAVDRAETLLDQDASNLSGSIVLPSSNARDSAAMPTSDDKLVEGSSATPALAEQVGPTIVDETTPMELDSRSPSPEVAEAVHSNDAEGESSDARQLSAPLPDQISGVAQPREAEQEIEIEAAGEAHDGPASQSASTLAPYESPLRYFHAYRFHPEFQRVVAGGLKSLTYSNRIDPDKELCPFELSGEQCPPNCEFQHFDAISAPDDQILVELGNADEYSGEEKSRFIQGLRELLQKFRADKVKDFDTIARGIIEFRSQLLGDKSKVLPLEGVTI